MSELNFYQSRIIGHRFWHTLLNYNKLYNLIDGRFLSFQEIKGWCTPTYILQVAILFFLFLLCFKAEVCLLLLCKMCVIFHHYLQLYHHGGTHLSSYLWGLLKVLACYAISWKLFCAASLTTSFSHQKPLKSKIQKHTLVGNMKFYYRAKAQPKQIKIEKLVWNRPLFDDSWPGTCTTTKHILKLLQKRTGNKLFRIVHPLIVMIMIVASRKTNKFHTLQYRTLLNTLKTKDNDNDDDYD